MGGIKTISIIVAANIKGLEAGLGKANKSIAGFATNAVRLGSMLSFGITAPLTALGKTAFDTFTTFESTIIRVGAITEATTKEFEMLESTAKKLGRTTSFTAQQFADLQLTLGKSGFTPKQIVDMSEAVSNLALVTGEDLSLAADIASSQIRSWGLTTEDTARVTNSLYVATVRAKMNLSKLTSALGYAAKPAKDLGLSFEMTLAMLGNVANQGIRVSTVGRGLRQIMARLTKKGLNLNDALDLIENSTNRGKTAISLFGQTAYGVALSLVEAREQTRGLTDDLHNNTTALDIATDKFKEGAQYKVVLFQSAMEGLRLEIGAILADYLIPLIGKLTILAQKFTDLNPETKEAAIRFAGMAAAFGPALLFGGAFIGILGTIGRLILFILRPVSLATTGVIALGAALYYVTQNFDNLLLKTVRFIGSMLPKFVLKGVKAFGFMPAAIEPYIQLLEQVFDQYGNIKGEADGNPILDPNNIELKSFSDILKDLKGNLKDFATEFAGLDDLLNDNSLKEIFEEFDLGSDSVDKLIEKMGSFIETYNTTMEGAANSTDRFFGTQLEKISSGLANAFDSQKAFKEVTVDGVTQMQEVYLSFGERFSNFVGDYLKQLGQMILQTAILAALVSVAFGGSAAGGKSFMKNFKNLIKGGDIFDGAYANGGRPAVGKMSLVGERGPELFVPDQAGTIIPNHALGGSSVVIPDVRISGDDLLIVFDRASRRKNRR